MSVVERWENFDELSRVVERLRKDTAFTTDRVVSLSNEDAEKTSSMIIHGDCIEILPTIAENSLDACVTDPPYGLRFMGKDWDHGVPGEHYWREVLRVLKPGGHLLAFGGTRTFHRLVCAIEDAGFEVRDSIADLISSDAHVQLFVQTLTDEQQSAFYKIIDESGFGGMLSWIYGSGFPKSLDVSKAIDKAAGAERTEVIETRRGGSALTLAGENPRPWHEKQAARNGEYDVKAPATAAARQWSGWGTALKPAMEPICLARKPLSGTVAENVLAWGTGALNVDGCRVESLDDTARVWKDGQAPSKSSWRRMEGRTDIPDGPSVTGGHDQGRWPANVIHDGSDDVLDGFPDAPGQLMDVKVDPGERKTQTCYGAMKRGHHEASAGREYSESGGTNFAMLPGARRLDSGSAARFFYTAKATQAERKGSKHPTVKPLDLMRYLVRLVTPPGGVVLDPFAGTGTTGQAALMEGMQYVLIEKDAQSVKDIETRMRDTQIGLSI